MKRLLTASLIAAAFASGAAFAQSPGVGPYVGASIGLSDYDWSGGCAGECDKTDIGFKVYGGYMFTPYIGAEVGYGAFGKAKIGVPVGSTAVSPSTDSRVTPYLRALGPPAFSATLPPMVHRSRELGSGG